MIVEDDDFLRRLMARILRQAGCRVREAKNSLEALRVLDRWTTADLVVSDVVTPGPGGLELAATLVERDIPMLIISGLSRTKFGPVRGCSPRLAYLSKPFTPAQLLGAVRRLLGGGRAEAPTGPSFTQAPAVARSS